MLYVCITFYVIHIYVIIDENPIINFYNTVYLVEQERQIFFLHYLIKYHISRSTTLARFFVLTVRNLQLILFIRALFMLLSRF